MDGRKRRDDLEYLVQSLLDERGERIRRQPGDLDDGELWDLFRALANTRRPGRADGEFYLRQDRYLRAVLEEGGISRVADLPRTPVEPRIRIYRGDICRIDADAIVNAANSRLLGCWVPGHHCIDNAIHTFAGVQLREECDAIMRAQGCEEPCGRAKVTGAYNLPCSRIIHTVGPVSSGRVDDELKAQLASCYLSCLDAAEACGCRSVVFCCISTGVFGFPNREAAEVAVGAVRGWIAGHVQSPLEAVFDLFSETDAAIYGELLGF